ncbi:MAG TPA: APC family permease [Acidimicrobiales bacterium]
MFTLLKRLLVGRPLATAEQEHQRIPKIVALAVFSSDAISSTAYALEEILFVTALGASSLALGLRVLIPIAIAVGILLVIVVTSYRRTIRAYPQGGGSYIVSRENLGRYPSLVAGASILVDYTLTVAVSISAGVAAIISIPRFRDVAESRVLLCLVLVAVLTLANLRGLKESGTAFAIPTYVYIATLGALVVYGLGRELFGEIERVPFDPEAFDGTRRAGGTLGLFLILKGFSSGAVALSGIEAIAVGVPAFRKPASRNASITLAWMALILGGLFFGTAYLASHLEPYPSHEETVLSQLGRAVFADGPLYLTLQLATAGILILAANTAYAAFPSLTSMMARDGFLPRQLANRGDRLVFSNGIVLLSIAASALIVGFGGITNALIPLYAVGVFTSFTLSQMGMVVYQRRQRVAGWRAGAATSAVGAATTFVVLVVVAATKFTSGAWIPIAILPLFIALFTAIRRHYTRLEKTLAITPEEVRPRAIVHTVVVLVSRVHRGVVDAIHYAQSLRPDHVLALYVAYEDEDREAMEAQWQAFGFDLPLEIANSPYREVTRAVETFLDELDDRWHNDTITVVIPEFVAGRLFSPTQLLHNQSAGALKLALLDRPNTVVTSVPYHVGTT